MKKKIISIVALLMALILIVSRRETITPAAETLWKIEASVSSVWRLAVKSRIGTRHPFSERFSKRLLQLNIKKAVWRALCNQA